MKADFPLLEWNTEATGQPGRLERARRPRRVVRLARRFAGIKAPLDLGRHGHQTSGLGGLAYSGIASCIWAAAGREATPNPDSGAGSVRSLGTKPYRSVITLTRASRSSR